MSRLSTIELHKDSMKFSAGHFTIFSATKRERLHGHNYTVYLALTTFVGDEGLSFDYRDYKEKIYALCRRLSQAFLLPTQSKFLKIEDDGDYINAYFNNEKMPFLKSDVELLPLTNITVEELSKWFVDHLASDQADLQKNKIQSILVKVSTSPGQSGSTQWTSTT